MLTRSWFYALAAAQLAIGANAHFFSLTSGDEDPHQNLEKLKVIIYETGEFSTSLQTFIDVAYKYGLEAVVVGQGSTFSGFGSKYGQLKDTLNEFTHDPTALVAVIDGRDVLLNVNRDVERSAFEGRIKEFIGSFKELVDGKPEAVLMSAEQQCCVAALCHADSPAFYFDPVTRQRNNRACPSGQEGCGWLNNANVKFWESLMVAEAYQHTGAREISPFLNAGMMLGTANNLIDMIERMDLGDEEDDQAVLSAMYLQFPELIVLDYEQKLLGNNAWPKGLEEGCIYDFDVNMTEKLYLTNKQTGTSPLLVHTPGKFYDCLDTLIDRLGGKSDLRFKPENKEMLARILGEGYGNYDNYNYQRNYAESNYGVSNYGVSNYGVSSTSEAPAAAPTSSLEDLTRAFEDVEEEDNTRSGALTWGLSCAAAGVLIAGLASRRRQTMTQEQHDNIQRALNDSDEAFALEDPKMDDAVSVISSAVDEAADPDSLDLMAHQPLGTVDEHHAMVDLPLSPSAGDDRQLKSILSIGVCDDVCGTKQSEDLRRNRTVHW